MSWSIKLPQWGMSMSEGTIAKWLVAEGDEVEEGQELVEVEAAKVTNTIAAPVAGTVGPLLVAEDETVEVNTVLCELLDPGEGSPTSSGGTGTATEEDTNGPPDGAELPLGEKAEVTPTAAAPDVEEAVPSSVSPQEAPAPDAGSADVPRDPATARKASGRVTGVVPLARKLAKEKGIDLREVTGSGRYGRIVVADVESAITEAGEASAGPSEDRPTSHPLSASAAGTGGRQVGGETKLSGMRRTIAERMSTSLRDSAQLTLTTTADVTDFAQLRESVGAGASKPSYVDAVIRASALALTDHPQVASHLDGETLVPAESIDIGLAVALEEGLIVPVIRGADQLDLAAVGAAVREKAEAARSGGLSPQDLEGGVFSVTSLGGQGIDSFTPILNPPQSAILGIGRAEEVPIRFGDGIAWRQEMTLSLTIDHRVIDGYPGALFLQDVVKLLENPRRLL